MRYTGGDFRTDRHFGRLGCRNDSRLLQHGFAAQARCLRHGHAERGQNYVSATVLGRPPAVEAGQLYVIAAGNEVCLDLLVTPFVALGQKLFGIGADPVQANLAKPLLNFLIYSTIEQMAEVFALNEKAGTDPHKIFEIMIGSFYNAPVHKNYGALMVNREYDFPASCDAGFQGCRHVYESGRRIGGSIALCFRGSGQVAECGEREGCGARLRDIAGTCPSGERPKTGFEAGLRH